MNGLPTYECDPEFRKLLARRSDVDVAIAALEFARDATPGLDFEPTLQWISDRAVELAGPVARSRSDREALEALVQCLSGSGRLIGHPSHFDDPDCSFLHRVVETGRGIPISLSVLYIAVAQRLGIDLMGAAVPVHFLARCETTEGVLFIDAFHAGRIMTRNETLTWLSRLSKLGRKELASTMVEASPRTIIIRMLNNLKALYARQEEWKLAWGVQNRLSALQPASYQERRDLAILSVRAERPGAAVDMLGGLLLQCPESDRATLEQMQQEAQSLLSRWN